VLSTCAQSSPSSPAAATHPTDLITVWIATAVLAVIGTWMGFAALPGINFPIWIVCAVSALMLVRRMGRTGGADSPALQYAPAALLALSCVLAGATAVTANPVRGTFLALISLALLAIALKMLAGAPPSALTPGSLLQLPLTLGHEVMCESARRADDTLAMLRSEGSAPYLRAIGLALPVSAVLALLLASADPTLGAWRDDLVEDLRSHELVLRVIFCIVLASILLGIYGGVLRPAGLASPSRATLDALRETGRMRLSTLERATVLTAVALLFALFFALQLSYLFSDQGSRAGTGVTFAEATHRGFEQMLLAAAVTAGVIMTLERHAQRGMHETALRVLAWSVVAGSLLLLVSAYERVRFYEAAYGFTLPRLNVQVCCAITAAALLLLAWELHALLDIARLCRRVLLVCVFAAAVVTFGNAPAWVVRANLARQAGTGRLDVAYLARLGRDLDAIPDLVRALPGLAPGVAAPLRQSLRETARRQSAALTESHWYEWNLRRARARAALRQMELSSP